jgi:hypothetical protein
MGVFWFVCWFVVSILLSTQIDDSKLRTQKVDMSSVYADNDEPLQGTRDYPYRHPLSIYEVSTIA